MEGADESAESGAYAVEAEQFDESADHEAYAVQGRGPGACTKFWEYLGYSEAVG